MDYPVKSCMVRRFDPGCDFKPRSCLRITKDDGRKINSKSTRNLSMLFDLRQDKLDFSVR